MSTLGNLGIFALAFRFPLSREWQWYCFEVPGTFAWNKKIPRCSRVHLSIICFQKIFVHSISSLYSTLKCLALFTKAKKNPDKLPGFYFLCYGNLPIHHHVAMMNARFCVTRLLWFCLFRTGYLSAHTCNLFQWTLIKVYPIYSKYQSTGPNFFIPYKHSLAPTFSNVPTSFATMI